VMGFPPGFLGWVELGILVGITTGTLTTLALLAIYTLGDRREDER
jgi:hypothetical protein